MINNFLIYRTPHNKETSQLYNPCTLQMCEELSHHHIMKSTDSDR